MTKPMIRHTTPTTGTTHTGTPARMGGASTTRTSGVWLATVGVPGGRGALTWVGTAGAGGTRAACGAFASCTPPRHSLGGITGLAPVGGGWDGEAPPRATDASACAISSALWKRVARSLDSARLKKPLQL